MQFGLGILFSIFISALAWRVGALTRSGAYAATITGGLIFGLGGLPWATLLLTFFISSSALSRAFKHQKAAVSEKFAKSSRRDWAQVLANGGLGALIVVLATYLPVENWLWIAYGGAMAAVNADTWATEIGVLNPKPPRLITNGKVVEPGTSGGISPVGILATISGAALIGVVTAGFSMEMKKLVLIGVITFCGLIGSLFDSLLGATVQAIYHCPTCNKETERHPNHACDTITTQIRGWRWLNNDMINFITSILGAGLAVMLWRLIQYY